MIKFNITLMNSIIISAGSVLHRYKKKKTKFTKVLLSSSGEKVYRKFVNPITFIMWIFIKDCNCNSNILVSELLNYPLS